MNGGKWTGRAAAAAGFLMLAMPCQAQIIIDQFSTPTPLLSATAGNSASADSSIVIGGSLSDRNLVASAQGSSRADTQITSSRFSMDAGGPGTGAFSVVLDYGALNLDLGSNFFFEFRLTRVVGTPVLSAVFRNTSKLLMLSDYVYLSPSETGYSVFLDLRNISGYEPRFMSGLNEFQIFLDDNKAATVSGNLVQFAPVPEPSVIALLSLSALWFAARYRRRRAGVNTVVPSTAS